MMGLIEESYRLPLVPISEQSKSKLRSVLSELGLLKETSHAAA
jgi:dihydrodipicolinate synthase/N-acetylneuraminate lyase